MPGQVLRQAASVRTGMYSPRLDSKDISLARTTIKTERSGRSRETPKLVFQSAPGWFGCPSVTGTTHLRASRCSSTRWPRSSSASWTPCWERGPGGRASSSCHPRAAQGCGSSRHLWPHAGDSWLPGPARACPSKQPPPPPQALLAKHPPRLPKPWAYSRLPGWLQLRERSWSFLPSLTQPKAPAPFCLRWDVGSGIPVGGSWESFPLGQWSAHAPCPQSQIYS